MDDKARLWLARGCTLVWIVWPRYQAIDVWRRGDQAARKVLHPGDQLEGEDVLPGLLYAVSKMVGLA
jgi:Uma2 family endonuclease